MTIKDKIIGCFLGTAIGDALGKPIESYTHEEIKTKFGRITQYIDCKSHKYFENDEKGTTTDDWQLTKSTAIGMIKGKGISLEEIAKDHVLEYEKSDRGWGGSTREAVIRLKEGVSYLDSGKTEIKGRGTGNGVVMKIAPLTMFSYLTKNVDIIKEVVNYTFMTHRTYLALDSSIVHLFALRKLFNSDPFNKERFLRVCRVASSCSQELFENNEEIKLIERINPLSDPYTFEDIVKGEKFGNGSCYVYNSLPFTYALFLLNPHSIETLYDCVYAGGDTDTNASIIGGMLGALNGHTIFPKELVDNLKCKDEVFQVAEDFYNQFK